MAPTVDVILDEELLTTYEIPKAEAGDSGGPTLADAVEQRLRQDGYGELAIANATIAVRAA